MRIAVLLSSYNGEKFIREQIDSILAQQGDFTLDLWVRDDGSTDATPGILEEYAAAGKLRWYAGENLRSTHSFLDLVKTCTGYDFYAFADQDDVWKPDKLARAASALAGKTEPAMVFSDAALVDGDLRPLGRTVYHHPPRCEYPTMLCIGGVLGCTTVMNEALAALIRSKPTPPQIILHDYYAATVCAAVGGQVLYDPYVSMLYRQHGGNVVGVKTDKWAELRARLRVIRTPKKISIALHAGTLYDNFADRMSPDNAAFTARVRDYRRSLWSRIGLALSRKTRYSSRNLGLTLRLTILCGNR